MGLCNREAQENRKILSSRSLNILHQLLRRSTPQLHCVFHHDCFVTTVTASRASAAHLCVTDPNDDPCGVEPTPGSDHHAHSCQSQLPRTTLVGLACWLVGWLAGWLVSVALSVASSGFVGCFVGWCCRVVGSWQVSWLVSWLLVCRLLVVDLDFNEH